MKSTQNCVCELYGRQTEIVVIRPFRLLWEMKSEDNYVTYPSNVQTKLKKTGEYNTRGQYAVVLKFKQS